MNESELVTIGQIVNTQGIRGEIRVVPFTSFPERFQGLERAFVGRENAWRAMHIQSVRYQRQFVILTLSEVPDMNAAETLKGLFIAVSSAERWQLPEGHYYVDDLKGMAVTEDTGRLLGAVTDIIETGANSVLVVGSGKKEFLVPMLKSVVLEVNLSERVITVHLLPGLEETGHAD